MVVIGKWDWLPENWEGYNGLNENTMMAVVDDIKCQKRMHPEDKLVGIYTDQQFEDTFNQDLNGLLTTKEYFIKIY